MSDQPQGDGWWRASNGKFYPPEQHPDYRPPAPPPPPPPPSVPPQPADEPTQPLAAPPPDEPAEPDAPTVPLPTESPDPGSPAGGDRPPGAAPPPPAATGAPPPSMAAPSDPPPFSTVPPPPPAPSSSVGPAAAARADAAKDSSGSRGKMLAIIGGLLVALLAAIALVVVLSGDGDGDGDESAATDDRATETTDVPATTQAPATTAPATTGAPASTEAPATTGGGGQGSGTPNDPFPIEGATFTIEESFGNATWDGELYGLVEVETDQFNDEEGRCVLVLGVLTPSAIERGVITNGFDTPEIGAIDADGIAVESTVADCETESAEEAGYSWINEATVTLGTPYAFYDEIFFAGDPEAGIQAIQVGGDAQDALFYQATVVESVPAPVLDDSASQPPPAGDPVAGAQFTYEEEFDDAAWDGRMVGIVEVPTGDFIDEPGRCYAVLGVLTPTQVEGEVSDPFNTPSIGMVSRGRYRPAQFNDCDVSAVEAQGYGWILDAEVPVGTAYPFYAEVFIPGQQPIQSLVVGPPTGEGALFYQGDVLDEVPAP